MKKWQIGLYLAGPVLMFATGKWIQSIEEYYTIGGYLCLLGIILFMLSLFYVGLHLRSIQCPQCGFTIVEPQKELDRKGILQCPNCSALIYRRNINAKSLK